MVSLPFEKISLLFYTKIFLIVELQWKDKQLQIYRKDANSVLVKTIMLRKYTTRGGIVIVQYFSDFFSVPI